jgi:hypothetical protein
MHLGALLDAFLYSSEYQNDNGQQHVKEVYVFFKNPLGLYSAGICFSNRFLLLLNLNVLDPKSTNTGR